MDIEQIVSDLRKDIENNSNKLEKAKGMYTDIDKRFDSIETKIQGSKTMYFTDFGGVGDGETDNTQAFIIMCEYIRSNNGNCKIIFPQGTYIYTPKFTNLTQWRDLVKISNCKNILIEGNNAVLNLVLTSSYYTHTQPYNQESPFQFSTCTNIIFNGLNINSDYIKYKVPLANEIRSESNCNGISFKSCENIVIKNCTFLGWGLNGVYFDPKISEDSRAKNKYIKIYDCVFDSCFRSAIHLKNVHSANIYDCVFKNSGFMEGYSAIQSYPKGYINNFGKQVDEFNSGIIIGDCTFQNNGLGSICYGNTKNSILSNCVIDEIYNNCCPINLKGFNENLIIISNIVSSCKKTFEFDYLNKDIKSITIINNRFTSTTCTNLEHSFVLKSSYPFISDIEIIANEFYGTGGIKITDLHMVQFKDNIIKATKLESKDSDCFNCLFDVPNLFFENNVIMIEESIIFQEEKWFEITSGNIKNNKFRTHSNAKMYLKDIGKDLNVNIGTNYFTPNFYYKGTSRATSLTETGFSKLPIGSYTLNNPSWGCQQLIQNIYPKVGDIILDLEPFGSFSQEIEIKRRLFYHVYICKANGYYNTQCWEDYFVGVIQKQINYDSVFYFLDNVSLGGISKGHNGLSINLRLDRTEGELLKVITYDGKKNSFVDINGSTVAISLIQDNLTPVI